MKLTYGKNWSALSTLPAVFVADGNVDLNEPISVSVGNWPDVFDSPMNFEAIPVKIVKP